MVEFSPIPADVAPPLSGALRTVSDFLPWILLIVLAAITGIVLFCLLRRKKRREAKEMPQETEKQEENTL